MLIILALAFLVMEVLDWYNPYMNFLGLTVSTILLIAFCFLSLMQSARMIFCERKLSELSDKKTKQEKKKESEFQEKTPKPTLRHTL